MGSGGFPSRSCNAREGLDKGSASCSTIEKVKGATSHDRCAVRLSPAAWRVADVVCATSAFKAPHFALSSSPLFPQLIQSHPNSITITTFFIEANRGTAFTRHLQVCHQQRSTVHNNLTGTTGGSRASQGPLGHPSCRTVGVKEEGHSTLR